MQSSNNILTIPSGDEWRALTIEEMDALLNKYQARVEKLKNIKAEKQAQNAKARGARIISLLESDEEETEGDISGAAERSKSVKEISIAEAPKRRAGLKA